MNNKVSFLKSIWFWWIILTIIYIPLYLNYLDKSHVETIGGHVAGLVGLFVPFGLLGLIWALVTLPLSLISIIIFFGGAYLFQKWFSKKNVNLFFSIVIIFIALFVLTFLTDFARGTGMESWNIFINGKISEL